MQQQFSKTMPVSVSRKFLEEYNNHNNDDDKLSLSPQSYSSFSRSISPVSPELFDSTISDHHSLYRQPTFSYIPIHKRRRRSVLMLSRSMMSLTSINQHSSSLTSTASTVSTTSTTPESEEVPSTPTSLFSSNSDQSMEYTSFPNLEKFSDECWTEIRVEKNDTSDIQMESYDEMLVGGICFQY